MSTETAPPAGVDTDQSGDLWEQPSDLWCAAYWPSAANGGITRSSQHIPECRECGKAYLKHPPAMWLDQRPPHSLPPARLVRVTFVQRGMAGVGGSVLATGREVGTGVSVCVQFDESGKIPLLVWRLHVRRRVVSEGWKRNNVGVNVWVPPDRFVTEQPGGWTFPQPSVYTGETLMPSDKALLYKGQGVVIVDAYTVTTEQATEMGERPGTYLSVVYDPTDRDYERCDYPLGTVIRDVPSVAVAFHANWRGWSPSGFTMASGWEQWDGHLPEGMAATA